MAFVLVATSTGCRVFSDDRDGQIELAGRIVWAMARDHEGGCLAIVDETANSLSVAVLPDEVLFSIQEGPFADRSQVWRCRLNGHRLQQVRQGLPRWLKGKVDTGHLTANKRQAAVLDGGGDLWLSKAGSTGWVRVANDLQGAFGVLIL